MIAFIRARLAAARGLWRHDRASFRDAAEARWLSLLLVSALCVATLILLWVGHRAILGWERSAAMLAERRVEEKATLLAVALDRDMKGVQVTVLGRISERRLDFRTPYDLVDLVASTFARYPYPDSMFVWRRDVSAGGQLHAFNRIDRLPQWDRDQHTRRASFPVVIRTDPPELAPLVSAIRGENTREQFVLHEPTIAGRRYQAVVSLFFDSSGDTEPAAAAGFLVDLDWVRREYFAGLLRQLESVIGDEDVSFSILDDRATPVARSSTKDSSAIVIDRHFPLAFFDRGLLAAQPAPGTIPQWTVRTSATRDAGSLTSMWRGLWWLMTGASIVALTGAILIGNTLRAAAELAVAKTEFVSTVTHDLKTPLALIRLVGETIGLGRYTSPATIERYGKLLSAEASRLTLQIDNLLAFARATDVRGVIPLESVDLLDAIQESLRRAEPRLRSLGFEVDAQLTEAPLVRADRTGLLQVLDNLIDNAIKYSPNVKALSIRTATDRRLAFVAIEDRGIGISEADREKVFHKFFRGRNVNAAGSGLGLAIVRRVLISHGGTVAVHSQLNVGTTVTIGIPLAEPL